MACRSLAWFFYYIQHQRLLVPSMISYPTNLFLKEELISVIGYRKATKEEWTGRIILLKKM